MKRQLLSLFWLLMLGGLAFGQSANIPVCNGTNGPNCTDYFGVRQLGQQPSAGWHDHRIHVDRRRQRIRGSDGHRHRHHRAQR